MYWFLLSLGSAFSKSLADAFSKQVMARMGEIAAGCVTRGLVAIFALIIVAWQGVPLIGSGFWKALLISGVINVVATYLTFRALKNGELSLVAPILALSPVFLLLTSPIINAQFPTFLGAIGMLMSVGGIYTLKVTEKKLGWLEPVKALWRSQGVKEALIASALYSISANYDFIGIKNSSPFFFIFVLNFFIFLCFFIPAVSRQGFFRSVWKNKKGLSLMSIFITSETGFQFTAFEMAIVPYVIAIKRTSTLFSVFWGKQFFKEKEFKNRFIGAIIVVAGLVLIKVFG